MKNVIYQIVNLVNGKRYIGSAMNFAARRRTHLSDLRLQKYRNTHLQNAYNKYGEDNFIFEIIDSVPYAEELLDRENYWFSKYDFDTELYNIDPVPGSRLGAYFPPMSEEHKDKISKALKNKKKSKSHCLNLSKALMGVGAGENNPMWGKKHSKKTRQKISEAIIKHHANTNVYKKPVYQLDKETGEILNEFISVTDAANFVNGHRADISKCCKGKLKTSKGYKWKYVSDLQLTK